MESNAQKPLPPLESHLEVLIHDIDKREIEGVVSCPLFTVPVLHSVQNRQHKSNSTRFQQYGLLGGITGMLNCLTRETSANSAHDPRVFANISSPSSTFICGSQGSGKSHTLSCLLENYLIRSHVNHLSSPLTALVFHYDTFMSDRGGSPCEAAYLASHPGIEVRVLCAPTNVTTIKRAYHTLNVTVEPLRIDETDLNTKRMLDLMAVKPEDGQVPLYFHTVQRILREMRLDQQAQMKPFRIHDFKSRLLQANLTPGQLGPLAQRMETLESFMQIEPSSQGNQKTKKKSKNGGQVTEQAKGKAKAKVVNKQIPGNSWQPQAASLTIVDLSCPCMTAETACSLFNMCLSIFLEQEMTVGRVVALDEAHKYMNSSPEAVAFTETILATIRLQRHLGARVLISTQEPTISPKLLDLSTAIIVHRFTSPDWMNVLKQHLAVLGPSNADALSGEEDSDSDSDEEYAVVGARTPHEIFTKIVGLSVGEALVFSPSAIVAVAKSDEGESTMVRLGFNHLRVRIRARITADGGRSVLAT